jgi:hypothetical protein
LKTIDPLNNSDFAAIAKLFSPVYIDFIANNQYEEINHIVTTYKKYFKFVDSFTVLEAYNNLYDVLKKSYRNEYVFKNGLYKSLILFNHKINDCVVIPEFNVGASKADLAVFNGTSTVYEIKSEIDSTERLKSQMDDYETFFEFLNVVISHKHLNKVKKIIPPAAGIYILDEKNKIHLEREATTNLHNITHKSLFYSLRKPEYLYIIERKYGFIPKIPNTQIFGYCYDLFSQIDIKEAHYLITEALKLRQFKDEQINLIKLLPESLKTISISKRYNKSKCNNIINNLSFLHN